MDIAKLKKQLQRDEGFRAQAYADSLGKLTIGFGRLIEAPGGISKTEADFLLTNDIDRVRMTLARALPWSERLDDARQGVILAMAFQLGINGLLGFRNALAAMQAHNWGTAAREVLDSRWAKQTPERAQRLADQIQTGEWM